MLDGWLHLETDSHNNAYTSVYLAYRQSIMGKEVGAPICVLTHQKYCNISKQIMLLFVNQLLQFTPRRKEKEQIHTIELGRPNTLLPHSYHA